LKKNKKKNKKIKVDRLVEPIIDFTKKCDIRNAEGIDDFSIQSPHGNEPKGCCEQERMLDIIV